MYYSYLKLNFPRTGTYATLTKLQKFCNSDSDFKTLIDLLCDTLDHKSDEYHNEEVDMITFYYYIIPNEDKTKKESKFSPTLVKEQTKKSLVKLKGYNLPSTINLSKWGTHLISEVDDKGNIIDTLKVFKQSNYI